MAPASAYFPANNNMNPPLQPPIGTPAQSPLPTNSAANGAAYMSNAASLWARVDSVQQADQVKTELLQELMYRYEYISQQYEQLLSTCRPEIAHLRNWENEKMTYEAKICAMQSAVARNPLVVVLIDGDGMVFQDDFVRDGEAGGRRAAAQLHKVIGSYIERELTSVPVESRVMCRIYANVKGLADVLVRVGTISDVGVFEDFVRGFTRGKVLFDFIDVGPGKDRADDKIIETFKLFINDLHCRQIFFGCSHDNGFARTLEEYMTEDGYLSKVTLLEGVPFEKELLALPYRTKKFPGIFRDSKIIVQGASYASPAVNATPPSVLKTFNMMTGLPTHFPPSTDPKSMNRSSVTEGSPLGNHALADISRTPSSSTLASDVGSFATTAKPTMNWAAKAAAPPPPASPKPKYEPVNREEVIARNRLGQRVDPMTRDYDKAEVDRVKAMKLCNIHFLRQECPYGNNCTHVHDFKPSPAEIATLRLVARMAPCMHGSSCTDFKCIYGHRCPAPQSKNTPVKGTKTCIFGDQCKFGPEMHDLDCNVVKTLVIR
ncbi:hypothetical protein DM02DRAFT_558973 [Periconia macrospinosa]|uniref:C3H1-type domain-containing protein n=1 Tax=Periconia macrospinosa TaxID=97972 RepID=A0A2V1DXR4_9PLEO|nr:hypothetical protein DM02DRAFT_558973 [Periconia macrospinosa]